MNDNEIAILNFAILKYELSTEPQITIYLYFLNNN